MKCCIVLVFLGLVVMASCTEVTNSSYYRREAKAFRMEKEKTLNTNEISQFLNTKNIVKTIVKLVFGTSEESSATSRQVLNLLVKVLDMVKTSFTQRNARSSSSVRGLRESFDDAAVASISMLKGFVRSVLTPDQQCVHRHICDAAAQASRESRELGYLIAQFGGYAIKFRALLSDFYQLIYDVFITAMHQATFWTIKNQFRLTRTMKLLGSDEVVANAKKCLLVSSLKSNSKPLKPTIFWLALSIKPAFD